MSIAAINAVMDEVLAAYISHAKEPTVVTGISNDGSSMSMGQLATQADRDQFMLMCEAAIAIKNGTASPGGPGLKLNFSSRQAST